VIVALCSLGVLTLQLLHPAMAVLSDKKIGYRVCCPRGLPGGDSIFGILL
jgi:hypothetical protein